MEAIDFLKNKGITKATCYTDGGTYYVSELAKLMEEYAAFRQPPVSGRSEQLVCDYCGKDKEEGLDHCECYNGTAWVKKAN